MKLELTKYNNRKLYSSEFKRYVNLTEVIEFIRDGGAVTVETKDGKQVTNEILKQAMLKVDVRNEDLVGLIRK